MIELIKFELKKIFCNKLVWITSVVLALFIVGIYPISAIKIKDKLGTREEVESLADKYINGDYSNSDITKLRTEIKEKDRNGKEKSKEEEFLHSCRSSFIIADKNENYGKIEKIDNEIGKMKENNKEDTFQYNNLLKEKEMLNKLPEKENMFVGEWKNILDFNVEATMKIILLTVGLAGVFSKEYSNRVAYINLSTKNGKTKLNTAKIISAFIYTTAVFVFVTTLFAITTSYLGLPNGEKPISFISESIYNISINEYFIYTLVFSYFGTLIFALFTVLLSLVTRNIIVEFGVPIILFIITNNFTLPEFAKYFNLSKLFSGKDILGSYEGLNVFGNVVLYPYVITFTGVIAVIVMAVLYKRFGRTQTIV